MNYPTIEPREAVPLAGKSWTIDGATYYFGEKLKGGGEAFVYSLHDEHGKLSYFARFVRGSNVSAAKTVRTNWLIAQRLAERSDAFFATPLKWVTTELNGYPEGFHKPFTATLHHAVPGISWQSLKTQLKDGKLPKLRKKTRLQIAKNLIAHLATWEMHGLLHGDVSDTNFLIVTETGDICFLDYDAFVALTGCDEKFAALAVGDKGVLGTPGYRPDDLEDNPSQLARAYSDRHARDMVLLEVLGFAKQFVDDLSPKFWNADEQLLLLKRAAPLARKLGLNHLLDPTVFTLPEEQRPSSTDLAIVSSCQMPVKFAISRRRQPFLKKWFSRTTTPETSNAILPLNKLKHEALEASWAQSRVLPLMLLGGIPFLLYWAAGGNKQFFAVYLGLCGVALLTLVLLRLRVRANSAKKTRPARNKEAKSSKQNKNEPWLSEAEWDAAAQFIMMPTYLGLTLDWRIALTIAVVLSTLVGILIGVRDLTRALLRRFKAGSQSLQA